MDFFQNKSFCIMPWINISVNPDGAIKPCCISKDFICKSEHVPYNLGYDTLDSIINSPDFIKIRKKMLAGEMIEGCVQCYNTEKHTDSQSKRMIFNNKFKNNPEAIRKVKQGLVIDSKVIDFDLRFGNLCNLSCRSCVPVCSSQLEKELIELKNKSNIKDYFYIIPNNKMNDWYETDMCWENLSSTIDSIEHIYISGGEPTLIKKNYEFLEYLVETKRSRNIYLMINSNITNLNKKFYKLIKEFKLVNLLCSIDGYGEIQEYLRYPSDWKTIDLNFQELLNLGENILIKPSSVIQIGNLNKLVELYDYFESFNKKFNKSIVKIQSTLLDSPSHLNINILPLDYKKSCYEKLENWVKINCQYQDSIFFQRLEALKHKCNVDGYDPVELKKFFDMNNIFDNHRQHWLKSVNPELYALSEHKYT